MSEFFKEKVTEDIEFAYRDSGPPSNTTATYMTILVIHGHTYHSGTFVPMFERANSFGYRMILPNRRLYPGSTTYTKEEADALEPSHSTEDITKAFLKQGEYLLMFVINVIKKHELKNVVLVAWSLGTAFLSAAVASITSVNEEIQKDLRKAVKSIIWWDPPATTHGISDPPSGNWHPLYDESLTPEERSQAFVQWIAHYYPHKNIEKKNCYDLIYKITNPVKTPTYTGISVKDLLAKIDLTAGANGDNAISSPHFYTVSTTVRGLAFFNEKIRSGWGNIPFNVIYGEESPYNVVWAAWKLEEESQRTGLELKVIGMPGANHFAMEDHTKLVFDYIQACST